MEHALFNSKLPG